MRYENDNDYLEARYMVSHLITEDMSHEEIVELVTEFMVCTLQGVDDTYNQQA